MVALNIKAWAVVFLVFFMITPVSQAESNISDRGGITLAHPEQVDTGQPFLIRLTSPQAFDKISIHWMDRVIIPSVSQWNRDHVAIAILGTDVLTIKPGPQTLSVRAFSREKETVWRQSVTIAARSYPRQELTLPSRMVTPPAVEFNRRFFS